jgi:hypothetical protein
LEGVAFIAVKLLIAHRLLLHLSVAMAFMKMVTGKRVKQIVEMEPV